MSPLNNARRRQLAAVVVSVIVVGACSSSGDSTTANDTTAPTTPATSAPSTAPVTASNAPATPQFAAMNPAVGYGTLRLMTAAEQPSERDVVIYETLPNDMPRVAGVLTTVDQTPLSHVNLRAVQDAIPNAYASDAATDPAIVALIGRYVRYEVTADGYTVTAATQAEVEAHHAAARPTEAQTPQRDLTVTTITPLSEVAFEDWKAFGVKSANVATLATLGLADVHVPTGYAVPFSFYDQFMQATGLYDEARAMIADEAFRTDPAAQEAQLAAFREAIKDAEMPASLMAELERIQASFPEGTSIRCRSSTNNEDLADFSGAGLYDSFTQHPDEGHLSKCIKQVYASIWNLRAYLEREFYRVDHFATAMGVLLHPNAEGEQVNGVAVTTHPLYGGTDFYVNAQLGEDLVTNPEANSVPEETMLRTDGTVQVLTYSNLAASGESLLSKQQSETLRAALQTIRDRFAELYGVSADEQFAMEIEFKIFADGRLSIKQARQWIFR